MTDVGAPIRALVLPNVRRIFFYLYLPGFVLSTLILCLLGYAWVAIPGFLYTWWMWRYLRQSLEIDRGDVVRHGVAMTARIDRAFIAAVSGTPARLFLHGVDEAGQVWKVRIASFDLARVADRYAGETDQAWLDRHLLIHPSLRTRGAPVRRVRRPSIGSLIAWTAVAALFVGAAVVGVVVVAPAL